MAVLISFLLVVLQYLLPVMLQVQESYPNISSSELMMIVNNWKKEQGEEPYKHSDFLCEVANNVGAAKVLVGHSSDDQIETVLMHLLRGAGLSGLRGLQPRSIFPLGKGKKQLEVVRPLLEVTRQETRDYCQLHGLQPRADSSNEVLDFVRNRVRLELLPVLRDYNPSVDRALLRLAVLAGDDASSTVK